MTAAYRRPESVLVVVHTDALALVLKRRRPFEFWQSVTGTLDPDETPAAAARRELAAETGLDAEGELEATGRTRRFVIDPRWRHRYAPGVVENTEYEWRYRLAAPVDIALSVDEHSAYEWLPIAEAAARVWSWTNREALERLIR
ncbi:MAG: dihydroneopterin triphosphate diphosphatase [Woeseiaceae bacterium]|nr:dihydroneopterin triphosphate diphosphatase [Woeseiaceae bacterium]